MNYLAHLYLSGNSEELVVGNFIGDYVKGRQFENYPGDVSKGILLHRQIDTFTDNHAVTREAKLLFRKDYGLYAGIVVDFVYDHFLAKNWSNYSELTLRTFAKRMHAILLANYLILPRRVQGFLPFLIQNKRLESYALLDGITQSMKIMSRHSSLPDKTEQARQILLENYSLLDTYFARFMDDMLSFVAGEHGVTIKKPDFSTRL